MSSPGLRLPARHQIPAGQPTAARRPRPHVLLGLVLVCEIALCGVAVAAADGLRAAPPAQPSRATVGEPVDTGRFTLTVRRAWAATEDPTGIPEYADPGRYLVVEADVALTAPETLQFGSDIDRAVRIRLPSGFTIDGDSPDSLKYRTGVVLALDRSAAQLHTGLPRRVRIVYELPARQPWPDRIEVDVYHLEFAPGFIDETPRWRVATEDRLAGRLRLPVAEPTR
ncbi:hypothetical protein ABN034_31030 [Actinopolymorpha sp. B11F2]|uniref:hypothetical protein n=1 Tax=Actinopolymorpha sp. B11F2 TaxID=3160862 RepID=UPI0032E3E00B